MSMVAVPPRSQSTDSFLLEGLDRASGDISPIGMISEAKTSTIQLRCEAQKHFY